MDKRAMPKPPITKSLLWKDGKSLQSLVLAIWIGILLFNLIVFVIGVWADGPTLGGYISVWLLMPNLVALGAPAMLVGTEEESGTLDWLRTLPVAWQKVIDSKFVAALAAVLATFLFASLFVLIARLSSNETQTALGDDLLRPLGVAKSLLFSSTLVAARVRDRLQYPVADRRVNRSRAIDHDRTPRSLPGLWVDSDRQIHDGRDGPGRRQLAQGADCHRHRRVLGLAVVAPAISGTAAYVSDSQNTVAAG